jgi:type II secretory pathway pseudopilin PulG
MKFTSTNSFSRGGRHRGEGGYILLVLILMVALLTIAAAAIAPSIAFQVKRDREEEMIHRGVQYSRAVQHYFKKFNRYPSKIEDLENTNNIRFLRKRYKDPITGQDFKVLHLSEVQLALAGGPVGGGLTPAAAGPGAGNQLGQSGNTFGLGNSPPASAASPQGTNPAGANPTDAAGSDQSTSGNTNSGASQPGGAQPVPDKLTGQTFGGGPIAGVVSASKKQSIREFYKKDHYNEWLFIYNPQADMGGLIKTPYQPALAGVAPMGQPGAAGVPGMPPSGFGNQAPPVGGGMQQSPQTVQPQQQPQQQ